MPHPGQKTFLGGRSPNGVETKASHEAIDLFDDLRTITEEDAKLQLMREQEQNILPNLGPEAQKVMKRAIEAEVGEFNDHDEEEQLTNAS